MIPKITVLMTVFNGKKYLKECMDSVLSQAFKDFEFLIVDDCSTDDSKELIKSYKDDRIRLIENKENLGQVKSLNIGIEHAMGEYIARMDQDDVMIKNRLKRQLDFLNKNKNISVVGAWGELIDENGVVFKKYICPIKNEEMIGRVLCGWNSLMHMSVIFKKDAVISVGKYNESFSFAEDHDLWVRLLLKGHKLANIPKFLIKCRFHKETSSKKFRGIQIKNARASTLNFIKAINSAYCDSDLDRLVDLLTNAGLMDREYWLDEMNIVHLRETTGLLEILLEKTIKYFRFKKRGIYLMKRVFCNIMLNFAYLSCDRRKKSLPIYLFCLKNFLYLYTRPKLYIYPLKSLL